MAIDDKFTESIIDSSLKVLKEEHGWDDELVNKIMGLYHSDNLLDIKSLSAAFEESASAKEVQDND